ncbi:putative bifunctional diguanylate cyclase/phosphodiesterase [Rubrivivax rivuli]|uniref:EAL domain-containing protein n=1 Tax=Rubrivivax rivuli TaxID=1862385 RepID=A0A437RKP5_9BURK|nr:EAL domain-containing protein [Rubrivivax rivuli]RVU47363.1 EAL domain-containing protein [Rubrivivax rivuli]
MASAPTPAPPPKSAPSALGLAWAVLLLGYGGGGLLWWRLHRHHQRARQRIDLLARFFANSGESMAILDKELRLIEVNPAFERETGHEAASILGTDSRLLLADAAQDPELLAQQFGTLATTGLWRGEVWVRHKEGHEYPRWTTMSVVRDELGRVTHYVCSAIDLSQVRQAEESLRHLASHDPLTQLPNRAHLRGQLEVALAAAHRDRHGLAVLFVDLDHFKKVNDNLGHGVGDALLVEVARRLRALVRGTDIVARLGGDEFGLVLTTESPGAAAAAEALASKVLHSLSQPCVVQGHEIYSSPSIGIALAPDNGEDSATLMKNADAAMYHAKRQGRNNYQFITPALRESMQMQLALDVGLRGVARRGELVLHYQPQLDLRSGLIIGVEALVRWQHPQLGLVPPSNFIPLAEETGQIEPIGLWVLEQALQQVALWRQAGHARLRVAVNVSARQLQADSFVGEVARALERHHLPSNALELELTEGVAMGDPERMATLLGQLRRIGVAVAIDDFGTGYSSLAYLKQLPLSCLKLDRSFVSDIERDANDAVICSASIQLAHSLGVGVVAEGVETTSQLEFLRHLGCDVVQGYFISRPLSSADCSRFLQEEAAPRRGGPTPPATPRAA